MHAVVVSWFICVESRSGQDIRRRVHRFELGVVPYLFAIFSCAILVFRPSVCIAPSGSCPAFCALLWCALCISVAASLSRVVAPIAREHVSSVLLNKRGFGLACWRLLRFVLYARYSTVHRVKSLEHFTWVRFFFSL